MFMIQNEINEENTWRMIPDNIEPGKGGGGGGVEGRGVRSGMPTSHSHWPAGLFCARGELHILRLFITFR